jgi:hypothetical protein
MSMDWTANTIVSMNEENQLCYHTITQEQYEQFEYHYVFDALKGLRFGQAFCERFGVSNASPLYHLNSRELCERWIRANYLAVKNIDIDTQAK